MITSVLIVLKHLNFGGTERNAINVANALVEKNITVTIVAGDGPYRPYISPKINLVIAPIARSGKERKIAERIILDTARKFEPQVIHAQCRNSLVCCQLTRRILQIPVISHEHMSYKDEEYSFVAQELDENCEKVISITPSISKKLIQNGLDVGKIKTILNGVQLDDFPLITKKERIAARTSLNFLRRDELIVCLSRIVPGKNIEELVKAFILIAEVSPHAKLVIAGDDEWGGTKIKVKELIKTNRLSKKVFLYPAQFHIRKFHAIADIFCYPALSKGMSVMEAMASGLPIVAKKSVKKPFVVEHTIHGLLTQGAKVHENELAEKLIALLKDKKRALEMGKAARARIEEKFTLETMVSHVLSTYHEVIDTHDILSKRKFERERPSTALYI